MGLPETRVWISDRALKELERLVRQGPEDKRLHKTVRRYAATGFRLHCGDKKPIRHKQGGVYAIQPGFTTVRLLGFFADDDLSEFIIIRLHRKRGSDADAQYRQAMRDVARIRTHATWQKQDPG